MKLDTILVPLDGSALAEYALPYATRLTRAGGGRLVLVRAAADGPERLQAETELTAVAERLFAAGLPVEAHVRPGPAGEAVIAGVRAWEAGLIVMATHGRSGLGRWLYGSVADHVLRHAPAPVLLVSPHCERRWTVGPEGGAGLAGAPAAPVSAGQVLVPLDGTELGLDALGPAVELAGALGAGLLLVQVVAFPPFASHGYGTALEVAPYTYDPESELVAAGRYLDAVAAPLRRAGHDVTTHADLGPAAPVIARLARERDAAAIAMATHGRGGVARVVLGSVATGVLQLAGAPLLLIRPVGPPAGPPAGTEATAGDQLAGAPAR
jgi:nucleotide-binding universal stress UspA family protein